ncbi:helix-turn-helix domain-containing protein [Comamonas thiooxydans]|uniref:Helix-turn-helix domain-containing protein n=1 Tax=Comamonas thiooxydans TaxID=363952 RepID=A0AA42Q1T2_9BURK|nr:MULTISPECIES: XRE family transcriptional regulator [Comamonas]MDH1333248.1 helix-turn-helix domain-containing protein [Comamonas thiooxydans]MDH1738979.1 helix-turn-helix domain-containing protein [Comamonas thiooxydans]MDH1786118.1 helix-turn-helix domain-containing protein [Comamonas thiooxydans]MPS94994.1 XRE family transcriptional regulator [Comamonas sp.]
MFAASTGMPVMDTTNTDQRDAYAVSLGDRIRSCRSGMTRDEFAALLELHVNTVGKFERGLTIPDAYTLMRMAAIGKCSPDWLMTGETKAAGVEFSVQAVERSDFVYVPHFDVAMSAGNGAFCDVEHVIAMRPFDTGFIRNALGIHHNELAVVSVVGNSMEPYLRSKDLAMLDLRARDVSTEGIHAIRLDGALMIKQVQRLPGKLRVSSANTEYAPFDVDGAEEQRDFSVIGRVRWGGVTFD